VQSFDFATFGIGTSISEMFEVGPRVFGDPNVLQLGFVNNSTTGMNDSPGAAFFGLRLRAIGDSGNSYQAQYLSKTSSGSESIVDAPDSVLLSPGNWFRFDAQFRRAGDEVAIVNARVYIYGPTGLENPQVLFAVPDTLMPNSEMTADPEIWAAFTASNAAGAIALDDLAMQAVPEPSTAILWGIGVTLTTFCSQLSRRFKK
jgi:hypothetical protein